MLLTQALYRAIRISLGRIVMEKKTPLPGMLGEYGIDRYKFKGGLKSRCLGRWFTEDLN